jgi:hypothetical protein
MSVFEAITPKGTEAQAQNLGDLLVKAADGLGQMTVGAIETAVTAVAHYGPGLVNSTLGAANDAAQGINGAVRGFGEAVSEIAAPKAAADNSPFANLGINFGSLNLGQKVSNDVDVCSFNHGLAGLGCKQSQGWGLAA